MKMKSLLAGLFIAVNHLASVSAQDTDMANEYRSFTGSNGKVIEAVLLTKSKDGVTLLLKNGKRATIPLDTLSENDRKYVADWDEAKALFLRECRGLTIQQLLELRGYESIKFEFDSNSIKVKGKLNDMDASFLVDTGAGTSLLHIPSARQSGAEVGPLTEKVYGVAGETAAGWTQINKLQFGESIFNDIRLLAADCAEDLNEEQRKGIDDMLMGADILSRLETVIDYKTRRIFFRPDLSDKNEAGAEDLESADDVDALSFRIFKKKDGNTLRGNIVSKDPNIVTLKLVNGKELKVPISSLSAEDAEYVYNWSEASDIFLKHCRSLTVEELLDLRSYQSFQYERRGNHIFVDGTINDNDVTFMIDTGADSSLLHLHWAKEFGCEIGPMNKFVHGIGGKAPAAATKVKKVTLGNAVLNDRIILATDLAREDLGQEDDSIDYVGLFGADYMRELEAVITYRESRIFLKPNQ